MAILSGARNEKNVFLSQKVFDRIQLLFPDANISQASPYVLLANTYGAQGDLPKAADVRTKMNKIGVKKVTGLSWTVVDEEIVVSNMKIKKRFKMTFDCLLALSCSRSISPSF